MGLFGQDSADQLHLFEGSRCADKTRTMFAKTPRALSLALSQFRADQVLLAGNPEDWYGPKPWSTGRIDGAKSRLRSADARFTAFHWDSQGKDRKRL